MDLGKKIGSGRLMSAFLFKVGEGRWESGGVAGEPATAVKFSGRVI